MADRLRESRHVTSGVVRHEISAVNNVDNGTVSWKVSRTIKFKAIIVIIELILLL